MDRFERARRAGWAVPARGASRAGARSPARTRRGRRALPRAGDRRGALVGGQGHPDPRPRRQREDGHQRDRGHHDPQARRARAALPRRSARRARLLARPRRAARRDGEPRGSRAGGLVLRRARDRRRRARAGGARARGSGEVRQRAIELGRRSPPDPDAPQGGTVVRTGQPELYPDIPDEMSAPRRSTRSTTSSSRAIGMRSAIVVPMAARGRTLGALTSVNGLVRAPLRRAGRRARRRSSPGAARPRSTTPASTATAPTSRAPSSRASCPSELPDIPGIETAARFRPTGEGNEVGGDFYDVFETGSRGWTVVMGDVCGKGPDAAAVTALARYTLRAAAMRERLPSRSLRILNEALLRQRDDRRFCTVAYAYLEKLDDGARAGCPAAAIRFRCCCAPTARWSRSAHRAHCSGCVPDPRSRGPVGHARSRRRAGLLHGRRDRERAAERGRHAR